jgi:NTP pyrophosphatase (non-canonical NTP hydrolase)
VFLPSSKRSVGGVMFLTFDYLRLTNKRRCEESFCHPIEDWNPAEWSNAMAGEVGEACNLTKKLLRGDEVSVKDIGKEIADVVIYADLLATRLGLSLESCVVDKFNETSERRQSSIRL